MSAKQYSFAFERSNTIACVKDIMSVIRGGYVSISFTGEFKGLAVRNLGDTFMQVLQQLLLFFCFLFIFFLTDLISCFHTFNPIWKAKVPPKIQVLALLVANGKLNALLSDLVRTEYYLFPFL